VKRTSSRTLLGLASVVLLIGAAACGDDDDSGSSATTAAAASATTAAASATTAATPTTKAATATTKAATATTKAGPTTTAAADTGGYGGGSATTAAAGGSATTAASGGAASASGAVSIADSSLGKILVDSKGMTLYMFLPDNQGPSTCVDKCLAAWPALAGPTTAGAGVDASKLGVAARPDGTQQATYGGWPLYTFIQDSAPGDVNGQDSGEKWYVIGADGQPIKEAS
jgi:predicted lipoprotein with Yx(FWY)xxD motif